MWASNFNEWSGSFCSWGPSFGHGPWFFGWIIPLLFWGFVAYLLFSAIKYIFSGDRSKQNDSAYEILRNRFASGEIDEQEYTTQKSVLKRR
jgi:putative membrane protein